MAEITNIGDFVQEGLELWVSKIAQAPLMNLAGVTKQTGVTDVRIPKLKSILNLSAGEKAESAIRTPTVNNLFSQNNLVPEIFEDAYDLPLSGLRKKFAGQYGSDGDGFLTSPVWLTQHNAQTLDSADVEFETQVVGKLIDKLDTPTTGTGLDVEVNAARISAQTYASPTTDTIANTNVGHIDNLYDNLPQAAKDSSERIYVAMSNTASGHLLRSFRRLYGDTVNIETVEVGTGFEYKVPGYRNVYVIESVGFSSGQANRAVMFQPSNLFIRSAVDFDQDFDGRASALWTRVKLAVDANFADYTEISHSVPAA